MKLMKLTLVAVMALGLAACDKDKGAVDEIPVGGSANGQAGNGTGAGGTAGNTGSVSQSSLDASSIEYFKQTIGDRVLFAVDKTSLTAEGAELLDRQAAWLLGNPGVSVLIEGHADEQGTREYNLALGARRASSVANYLVSKGLPDGQVKTITYGKERPIEVCSSESCYAKNRRAVTVVAGGLGS